MILVVLGRATAETAEALSNTMPLMVEMVVAMAIMAILLTMSLLILQKKAK